MNTRYIVWRCAAICTAFLVLSAAAATPPLSLRGGIDIDGSGKSVLLLRSSSAQMQVGRFASNQFTFTSQPDPGANYRLIAVSDFDGNGKSDLAFQDMTQPGDFGDVHAWTDFNPASDHVLRTVKRAWVVEAVGDLDGDGFGDMTFRFTGDDGTPNDTGVSYVWFQKSGGLYDNVRKRGGAPLNWTLAGAADLNGDGAADMIYVNPYGQIRALMATNNPARSCANLVTVSPVPDGFTALQIGDFTGNKRGDVLVRNSVTGEVTVLALNANGLTLPPSTADPNDPNASCTSSSLTIAVTSYSLPVTPSNWSFYAAGDFNGDGVFDIAWLKPDGTLAVWLMAPSGAAPTVIANAGTPPAGYKVFQMGVGGGAPATTITGTASAGAPIVGYVTVKDSANPQHVLNNIAVDANGKYTADVSGMTPPFMFFATGTIGGRPVSYYSAATQADAGGTINITPFTDLMVRNAAAGLADAMFNSPSSMTANLSAAQIDAQRVQLTNALAPVLSAAGLSNSIDLLRAAFNADHTGLDRFMDLIHVTPGSSAAQYLIQNILDTSTSLTVNTTSGQVSGAVSTSGIVSTQTSPADLINQTFKSFQSYFVSSLPSPSDPGLTALFASSFLNDGQNASSFLSGITGSSYLIGVNVSNLTIGNVNLNAGTATVTFTPRLANGISQSLLSWQMKRSQSGAWQVNGNQHIAKVEVVAFAVKQNRLPGSGIASNGCASALTGLNLSVDDQAHAGVNSALVSGPGLPQAGVLLTVQNGDTQLYIPTNVACGFGSAYPLSDAALAGVSDGNQYTMVLYGSGNGSGTPLATYTSTLFKAPVLNSALSGVAFATVDNASTLTSLLSGGTFVLDWTLPVGSSGDYVNVCAGVSNTSSCTITEVDLSGRTASGASTFVVPAGRYIGLSSQIGILDGYNRHVWTNYF